MPIVKPPLEIVAGFHNIPHLVVVGASGGYLADFCFVDPQVPAHLYLHPVGGHFVKEEVHINGLSCVDKRREPCGSYQCFVTRGWDVQIGMINAIDHHIPGVAEIQIIRTGVIGSTHFLQVAAGQPQLKGPVYLILQAGFLCVVVIQQGMEELEQELVFFLLAPKFHRGVAALGKVTSKIAGGAL